MRALRAPSFPRARARKRRLCLGGGVYGMLQPIATRDNASAERRGGFTRKQSRYLWLAVVIALTVHEAGMVPPCRQTVGHADACACRSATLPSLRAPHRGIGTMACMAAPPRHVFLGEARSFGVTVLRTSRVLWSSACACFAAYRPPPVGRNVQSVRPAVRDDAPPVRWVSACCAGHALAAAADGIEPLALGAFLLGPVCRPRPVCPSV